MEETERKKKRFRERVRWNNNQNQKRHQIKVYSFVNVNQEATKNNSAMSQTVRQLYLIQYWQTIITVIIGSGNNNMAKPNHVNHSDTWKNNISYYDNYELWERSRGRQRVRGKMREYKQVH